MTFSTRAQGYIRRRAARALFRRTCPINTKVPLISFTFDDFPRTALFNGGSILNRFGLRGTYYAAFGLMRKQAPEGQIFCPDDLNVLFEQGHELGCHTFDHCDSGSTEPREFEDSIMKNRRALSDLFPAASFKTFSYPHTGPRPWIKKRAAQHFVCCRGGDQSFNHGTADLNYLSAYFLEKSGNNPDVVKAVIDRNKAAGGWLILATHDVCEDASPWGCKPDFFEEIVQYAVNSGARILPVIDACNTLRNV